MEVQIGDSAVTGEFFLFELGGVDVILGVAWLATLGEVKVNWRTLTMTFMSQGKVVEVRGDPSLVKTLISSKALLKVYEVEAMSMLWVMGFSSEGKDQSGNEGITVEQQKQLQQVLQEFEQVFAIPEGLPPSREVDHRISIKAGTDPVNVRPYRYPHLQKNEIEKLVTEMLASGIIRPSNSPYSSLMILVKKKDGSWRFCVDYRALNKATIPDKFLIPVIEELLDELNEATYFSKIDLRAGYHQIRMYGADIPKTAFRTHQGHYGS